MTTQEEREMNAEQHAVMKAAAEREAKALASARGSSAEAGSASAEAAKAAPERWMIYICSECGREECRYHLRESVRRCFAEVHGNRETLEDFPALESVEVVPAAQLEEALEDADRLRTALERIADDDCGPWDHAMRYARKVLAATTGGT